MNVQVQSRPAIPSETQLPDGLVGLFLSHGMRPSWQKNTAEMLSTYHGQGLKPVTRKMLEELGRADAEDGEESGFDQESLFFTPEGYVQKYDCLLMVQPVGLWDQKRAVVEAITRRRESKGEHVEKLNAELDSLMQRTGVNPGKLVAGGRLYEPSVNVPEASEHITVSKVPRR